MKKARTAKRLIEAYLRVVEDRKALEATEKELKAEIVALMEDNTDEVGCYLIKNTPIESMRIDSKRARAELGEAKYISLCNRVLSHRFTVSI